MIDSFQGDNRFLSNFWPVPIVFEGVMYNSVEHAYVAAKSLDPEFRQRIAASVKPGEAKRLGRGVSLRPDWEDVKLVLMEGFLRQKFAEPNLTETAYLAEKLLATGEQELVEGNHWGDTFWGVCKGVGDNNLGKLLMKIRADLRA